MGGTVKLPSTLLPKLKWLYNLLQEGIQKRNRDCLYLLGRREGKDGKQNG